MASRTVRLLAAFVAGIIVVVTAIAVGLLARPVSCDTRTVAAGQPTATQTDAAGLGNADAPATAPASAPAVAQQEPVTTQETVCTRRAFGFAASSVTLLGALFAVVAVIAMMLAGGRRPVPAPTQPPVQPAAQPPVSPADRVRQTEADRETLVDAVIYVRDRLTSKALADRLGRALGQAGIRQIDPAGSAFDPARHEAGGSTPADDPVNVGRIAAVEVPGYADRNGRLLRPPVVTVYQPAGPKPGEPR
jgi:hypothetical protein